MTLFFVLLGVILYLVLLVDWKNLIEVLGLGGWPSVVLYAVLAVFVVVILTNPDIPHIMPIEPH